MCTELSSSVVMRQHELVLATPTGLSLTVRAVRCGVDVAVPRS